MADNFIKGAQEAGHSVVRFDSAFKKVHPCIACDKCAASGQCVFKDDFEFVKQNLEMFKTYGFDLEIFGENAVKVNGIPDIEYRSKSKNIFLEILDEMITNERVSLKDVEERFVATVACKAAVKANMDLTQEEVYYLIQNLLKLKNPYTCPHGRPTTIKLNEKDLKKLATL